MAQAYHVNALGLAKFGSALRVVSGLSVVTKRSVVTKWGGKPLSEKDGPFQLVVPGGRTLIESPGWYTPLQEGFAE